ncbi:MAG: ABC transporter ATP-binding protein [Thermodesulfobacteriota bacterium]
MVHETKNRDAYLKVRSITKNFGGVTALQEVSFQAGYGEFISVLGPSGCGKTTLLRVIAGLETQNAGRIFVEDQDMSQFPVSRRSVGIVFQSYALFPNLNVMQNIAYGLKGKMKGSDIQERVSELLHLVGLEGYGRQFPAQLSGGQQQRVALARAIAPSPKLLLLDEPLSALDAKVRTRLRGEIRRLQRRLRVTTVMVTHDQEEALTMADRILVMDRGFLVQDGTPHEIYDRPATPFVASFIGSMNFIENAVQTNGGVYRVGDHRFQVLGDDGASGLGEGSRAVLAIRPEDVMIGPNGGADPNTLNGRVEGMEYRGPVFRVGFRLAVGDGRDIRIESEVPTEKIRRLAVREAMEVPVRFPTDRLRVYAA